MRTSRLLVAAAALAAFAAPAVAQGPGPGPGPGCTMTWSPITSDDAPVQLYTPSGMVC
jgi:hypothetical protein